MTNAGAANPVEVLAARVRVAVDRKQGRTSPTWLEELASSEIDSPSDPAGLPARTAPDSMRAGHSPVQPSDVASEPPGVTRLGSRALARLPGRLIHGDDVRELQVRLAEMGYAEVGPADGVFGPDTELAVRRFQNDFGILNDGVCGRVTARVLRFLQQEGAETAAEVTAPQRNLISFIVHAQHSGLILVDLVSGRLRDADQNTAALEDLLLESLGNKLEGAIERLTGMQTWIVGNADFTSEDELVSFATNIGSELYLTLSLSNDHARGAGCTVFYFGDAKTGIHSNIGLPLATYVHNGIGQEAHPTALDLEPRQSSLFERVQAPTIEIEFGNLANQADRQRLLGDNQYLDGIAEGIARGIKNLYLLGQHDDEDRVLNLGTFARRVPRARGA